MSTAHSAVPPQLLAADRRRLGHFELRMLAPPDAPSVLALRSEVLTQLEHPDFYVREDDEDAFVRRHVGGNGGETIGVFDGARLVAYAMIGWPAASDADNLGAHLDLAPRGLGDVAHIAGCMVHAADRGHGLQRTLLAARFSLSQAHGRFVCIAMVSLHNHASRHNMLREGMRIAWVGEIDGLRRQLMALDLGRPWTFDRENARLVPALDFDQQRALTAQGWWGIGSVDERGGDGQLVFARHAGSPSPT